MARFHFQVADSEGKVRSGTMEATSLAEAREVARRRGYTVIELRALDGEDAKAVIQVQTKSASLRHHSGPAAQREFKPGLLQRLQDRFSLQQVKMVMLLLSVVGLLWMYAAWRTPGAPPKGSAIQAKVTPQMTSLKLVVAGEVKVEGSDTVQGVQITLDLPEIPYQQTYEWYKLEHPKPGHFLIKTEFDSVRRARKMLVRARKPGFGVGSSQEINIAPTGGSYSGLSIVVKPDPRP